MVEASGQARDFIVKPRAFRNIDGFGTRALDVRS